MQLEGLGELINSLTSFGIKMMLSSYIFIYYIQLYK
jgi:hypothetical protein